MKVRNESATIITLRCGKGKDVLKPLEVKTIMKENEEYAQLLIDEGKLKEATSAPKKPSEK